MRLCLLVFCWAVLLGIAVGLYCVTVGLFCWLLLRCEGYGCCNRCRVSNYGLTQLVFGFFGGFYLQPLFWIVWFLLLSVVLLLVGPAAYLVWAVCFSFLLVLAASLLQFLAGSWVLLMLLAVWAGVSVIGLQPFWAFSFALVLAFGTGFPCSCLLYFFFLLFV